LSGRPASRDEHWLVHRWIVRQHSDEIGAPGAVNATSIWAELVFVGGGQNDGHANAAMR
jgi:hypothetical protein